MSAEGSNPHDLVNNEDVQKALLAAEGPTATLKSFEMVDFTKKGDNYACIVSSVKVCYQKDGRDLTTSFVVKLNPCRPAGSLDKMIKMLFEKESFFYQTLVPLLNTEFERLGERGLNVAKHYHSVTEEGKQVIYLEDMRADGFKMLDRKIGMDRAHTNLVLTELARLHAISKVLFSKEEYQNVNIQKKFNLSDVFTDLIEMEPEGPMSDWFPKSLETSAEIAENSKGYEYVAKYLRDMVPNVKDIFKSLLVAEEPFIALCHGDCWNNNFLYKYDDKGVPIECRLLDLQITRYTSPTIDLNYMLYCSLNGDVRKDNLDDFLATYYANFASVLAANKQPVNFTIEQLKKDYYKRSDFGLITGMSLIPIVLMDTEDAPDIKDFVDENMEKAMADFKQSIMDSIQKNPLLKSRFLCMFDEMKEIGVFDKVLK